MTARHAASGALRGPYVTWMVRVPVLVSVAGLLLAAGRGSASDTVTEHFDGVLGTSMDITVIGAAEGRAVGAIGQTVAEVERLEALLSSYREDSEVARLNRLRELEQPSAELRALLDQCRRWAQLSQNRFSCKLGRVRTAWREAEHAQAPPDRVRLRRLARDIAATELAPDPDGSNPLRLPELVDLDPGGIAKGFIVDRALDAVREALPEAVAIKVDIGGDARYWGTPPRSDGWQVGIGPDGEAGRLVLSDAAVAASGHSERGYRIGRRHYSHILAPRDGWPLADAPAAIVTAAQAVEADAIATALVSMPPQEAISWVSGMPGVEALLILDNGTQIASPGWRAREQAPEGPGPNARLRVEYTIPEIQAGEYRRPYLAIWISDADRQAVRNLLLLGESQRWARENSRWWRQVGRVDATILDGYALATRRPGRYAVTWDGYDDRGRPVATQQPLVLHVEAAREYGGHDYRRIAIDTRTPAPQQHPAKGEIGAIGIHWVTEPDLALAR